MSFDKISHRVFSTYMCMLLQYIVLPPRALPLSVHISICLSHLSLAQPFLYLCRTSYDNPPGLLAWTKWLPISSSHKVGLPVLLCVRIGQMFWHVILSSPGHTQIAPIISFLLLGFHIVLSGHHPICPEPFPDHSIWRITPMTGLKQKIHPPFPSNLI